MTANEFANGILPADTVSGRILVLEEDRSLRKLLHYFMERLGCRSVAVKSTVEACAVLDAPGGRIDVAVLSVVDPLGLDLQPVLRKIATMPRRPQVIVLACTVREDERRRLKAMGVMEVLEKPFLLKTLAHLIQQALSGE